MSVEAAREQGWDDFFVEMDKKADYIPIVSTLTNVSELILKGALSLMDQERLEETLKSHFFQHIQDKSTVRSVALLVPVVGNGIIYIYDTETGELSGREVVNEEGEIVPVEEAEEILQKAAGVSTLQTPVTLFIPVSQEPVSPNPQREANAPTPPTSPETPRFEKLPPLKPKLIKAGLGVRI